MANRRFGGGMGGGPQRGRSNFSQQQYHQGGNNVSPWQAQNNNPLNQGILSQLSTPQQLALAITSLLQQPEQPQQQNPPSLLSLNTAPFGQGNYDNKNRFGANRGRNDFKRLEPYKNRGNNWRNEVNRPRTGGNFNNRNNQQRNRDNWNRSDSSKDRSKVADKEKDDKKTDKEDKSLKVDESKDGDNTVDMSTDDLRDDETKEKKRDWKEEKNVSDEKGDGDGRKESADAKTDNDDDEKKSGAAVDKDHDESGGKKTQQREGRYYGVPPALLHCFVCNKSMWDGESFQNHIRGKAHKQMLQSLEESFQITVNILRENMRLVEEQKMIELSRMSRNNRNFRGKVQEPQSTCNMCDLKFIGKIIVHRKTEGHQRLKRFLHPNCNVCKQEFPARMEWVEHRFSPEHLRKLKEVMDNKVGGADGAIKEEELSLDLEPLLEEPLQVEHEKPVLELSDDMANFQNRIPAYKKTRAVGTENLKPSSGFLCELCDRFFPSEEIAQAHLKTQRHYYNFVEAAKRKNKRAATDKAEDDDGNWKRKKLDESAEGEEREQKEGEAEAEEKKDEDDTLNGDGSEMYDPEEACDEKDQPEEEQDEQEAAKKVEVKQEVKQETPPSVSSGDINDVSISSAEPENLLVEVKSEKFEEEVKKTSTPAARGRRGNALNGAGPKSKRGRK